MLSKYLKLGVVLATSVALVGCEQQEDGINIGIDGVKGPTVSVSGEYVMMSFVFEDLAIDGGATIPIPKFGNSTLSIGPDFQSGGTLLQVAVKAGDFWNGQNLQLDPTTLPGGRPLPTVNGGSLPAVAVVIPNLYNTVLYIGKDVLGFFVPFDLKTQGIGLSYNFFDGNKKKIGTISLVGEDAQKKNAGILLLLSTKLLDIDKFKPKM